MKEIRPLSDVAIKDGHHWADFAELLCLYNKDSILSHGDFIDRIKRLRDREDDVIHDGEKKNINLNEKYSLLAEDVFSLLQYRIEAFKEFYPFKLSVDNTCLVTTELDKNKKIYLYLLTSSCLGNFAKYKSKLTSGFEHISHEVLSNLLPTGSEVHLFGSSNVEDCPTDQEKNVTLWDKIVKLASNIKEEIKIKEEQLSKYNKGDHGLDVYGYIKLDNNNKHFPLFFGQCACTPEWVKKQSSSKFDNWDNLITFSTYPLNFIFIPYSFRSANGEWHEYHQIQKSILIDRERIIYNFKNKPVKFSNLEVFKIIDEIISNKESLV